MQYKFPASSNEIKFQSIKNKSNFELELKM
jgi:hypothetical protein